MQDIEGQRAFYQSSPPRCLDGFEVRPAELSAYRFDGHGEIPNSYWSIACPCGGSKFRIYGHSYTCHPDNGEEYPIFLSPVQLECAACGRAAPVFDGSIHGFDPEIDAACASLYDPADSGALKMLYRCEDGLCLDDCFTVFARFEYPGGLLDEGFDGFKGREKDLFSWFTLVADCSHCGKRSTAADFECA